MKSDRIKANQRRGLPTLCFVAVALLALVGLLQPRAAHAATITVANGEVAINDNGLCSLREAIDNANFDFALYDDCAAGSGADIISCQPTAASPSPIVIPTSSATRVCRW